ncbi:MAG: signal recognition particle-docking protein FtsY [Oscillospiraceae bacterium]|nr:signal recognition particle-docking protein FtsY [Oscillospiraceae bacterium]
MTFFERIKNTLKKTLDTARFTFSSQKLDDDFFDQLEEQLILADTGYETATSIVAALRAKVKQLLITDVELARNELISIVTEMLTADSEQNVESTLKVILMIGVNGSGKTTTSGKLAYLFKNQGKSVILAAADTFRAAAVEQLEIWADRSDVTIIRGANDPSSVIYDAVSSAVARKVDVVICDTAGRLHTKKNLMEELSKMTRTVKKACSVASLEVLLVIDSVTGQNALSQAAQFAVDAGVSGIVLTKLDGTAKGGSVIAIKQKLGIPVRYIGVGEALDDLLEFDPVAFATALFS